jgi:hypothetical protein
VDLSPYCRTPSHTKVDESVDGGSIVLNASAATFKGLASMSTLLRQQGSRTFLCAHVDGRTCASKDSHQRRKRWLYRHTDLRNRGHDKGAIRCLPRLRHADHSAAPLWCRRRNRQGCSIPCLGRQHVCHWAGVNSSMQSNRILVHMRVSNISDGCRLVAISDDA